MVPPLKPVCTFEPLDPADLASAIESASGSLSTTAVRVPQLGLGYEAFLGWAVRDVQAAVASKDSDEQARFSVSAVMNARRSLSCLVDQFLMRDAFAFCRDAPHDAKEKADLLVRRGVFDTLASEALQRALAQRNAVEHRYEHIAPPEAADVVHMIRATIENCVATSDPYRASVIFGSYLGGHSGGPQGEKHFFQGWSKLMFVLARSESPPWFGVVIPTSSTEANVRKVFFSELSCEQLLGALAAMEAKASSGYLEYGEATFRRQLASLALTK